MEWYYILLIINAVCGLIAFEWTWRKTYRYRNPIKELDEQFPAYRRLDAFKWRKIDFYFGAVTIMIPRILWLFLVVGCLTLVVKLILIGAPKDGKLRGTRKKCLAFWYKLGVHLISLISFFTVLRHRY